MNKLPHLSPVRKIGITNRSVSGVMPNIGSYESSLERDFMEWLRFDDSVKTITPQPLTIGYSDKFNNQRSYTPDGLITFQDDLNIQPILYEIKYRADFRNSWKQLLLKFRVAKDLARSRGWQFKVYTEVEIRTAYLDNVKFLWRYKHLPVETEMVNHVLSIMSDLQEADPDFLLTVLCSSPKNKATMIPVIWHLIANFRLGCDLDRHLTMLSKIWMVEDL